MVITSYIIAAATLARRQWNVDRMITRHFDVHSRDMQRDAHHTLARKELNQCGDDDTPRNLNIHVRIGISYPSSPGVVAISLFRMRVKRQSKTVVS